VPVETSVTVLVPKGYQIEDYRQAQPGEHYIHGYVVKIWMDSCPSTTMLFIVTRKPFWRQAILDDLKFISDETPIPAQIGKYKGTLVGWEDHQFIMEYYDNGIRRILKDSRIEILVT